MSPPSSHRELLHNHRSHHRACFLIGGRVSLLVMLPLLSHSFTTTHFWPRLCPHCISLLVVHRSSSQKLKATQIISIVIASRPHGSAASRPHTPHSSRPDFAVVCCLF
ncbi:hypothetical protein SESBI_34892 [Sesbania bispinosa]|nr:hypothetical protein SESBI_34892 [Sesbania bispinosa]